MRAKMSGELPRWRGVGRVRNVHMVFGVAVFDVVTVVISFDRTVILGCFMKGVSLAALMYQCVWNGLLV